MVLSAAIWTSDLSARGLLLGTGRSEKRVLVWQFLQDLSASGLGDAAVVSPQRDKLVLDVEYPRASALSDRPDADGFIRADEDSFLFRSASTDLRDLVPAALKARSMASEKGLEFRWTQIDVEDIRLLMALVRWVACRGA